MHTSGTQSVYGVQVNEVLEAQVQQLEAHKHPHASAVQAAINLAGSSLHPQKAMHQVTLFPDSFHLLPCLTPASLGARNYRLQCRAI